MKKFIIYTASALVLAGCGTQEEGRHANNQQNNLQPIHYETPDQQGDRLGEDRSIGQRGGYPQSELEGLNAGETNDRTQDRYTNDQTTEISEHLSQLNFVKQAQVTSTDDRIVVAVMLNNHTEQTSLDGTDAEVEQIKHEVRRFVQDKTVVVYTDNIYWNRMRNINANQISNENVNQFLEDFFNTDQ
ncbi:Sporulation lipoprotein YhcN/YlaJ (Spore_YhcN_YlaJ) [Oceanobacillus limi]|uniref:Sporulation lipoprotein YhcN/YlaJ (Spore_YhcN_YlaJ) n=1 Tax=Oceanobacillus limi TaxID=930131 RepID=A0A1I0HI63_9BACI|nr:YhcN/YlaJ family sporulation lipoprotein [Oceanobacillus limi]SET82745.1 Sporulation lipoprotein YhcN/YlaJ (Spore_YhcN_YlaJ) [Oceanobacillus limi]